MFVADVLTKLCNISRWNGWIVTVDMVCRTEWQVSVEKNHQRMLRIFRGGVSLMSRPNVSLSFSCGCATPACPRTPGLCLLFASI